MLLGLYLGSTGYVINQVVKFLKKSKEQLSDEGYLFRGRKLSKKDKKLIMCYFYVLLTPIINIVIPYIISHYPDKVYEILKKKLIILDQIIDYETADRIIINRINRDSLLKLDNEIMKTLLMPEELEEKRREEEQRKLNDAKVEKNEYIFSNYPLMDQIYEQEETNIEPNGFVYKKRR